MVGVGVIVLDFVILKLLGIWNMSSLLHGNRDWVIYMMFTRPEVFCDWSLFPSAEKNNQKADSCQQLLPTTQVVVTWHDEVTATAEWLFSSKLEPVLTQWVISNTENNDILSHFELKRFPPKPGGRFPLRSLGQWWIHRVPQSKSGQW